MINRDRNPAQRSNLLHRALADASKAHASPPTPITSAAEVAVSGSAQVAPQHGVRPRRIDPRIPSSTPPSSNGTRGVLPPPEYVDSLRLEEIPGVLAQIGVLQARGAARLVLESNIDDAFLTAPEAAKILGMSLDWLYRNANDLPFTRRVGPRTLKFSKNGIRRYLATRRP